MKQIDAALLKKMFIGGAKRLEAHKEHINELNVFPVPDGDTGTNMTMTIMSAAKEVSAIDDPTIEELAKAISGGSLRGARGNSGVILSQLFRGFTKQIKYLDRLTTKDVAAGFKKAVDTAYKAVMKPKEGTILTVAKAAADSALRSAKKTDDFEEFAQIVMREANTALQMTPEMLPVLKEAGVVDSGGQGLIEVLQGAYDVLLGKEVDLSVEAAVKPKQKPMGAASKETADITFGYCTEFIVMLDKEFGSGQEQEFKDYLTAMGDSIVVVADEDIVKVHVHTNHPGKAIEKGLSYGALTSMKIDNMREEHEERLNLSRQAEEQEPAPRKDMGFVAVSIGNGLNDIFRELGADYLIEGGQTMNPSTEDMLNAIAKVNADTIFILPNNKNIILAANQARDLTEDKKIVVIPSRTVPQGITALVNFIPDLTPEENLENMTSEMERVRTAQITYAVRNTTIDGMEIHEGDIMAIGDRGMLAVDRSVSRAAQKALEAMLDKDSELVTIYYGSDVAKEDAVSLKEQAKEEFPDKEIELQYGGQPIYYYMISAE